MGAHGADPYDISRILDAVHKDAMIVGFCTQVRAYKRPTLLFRDIESLREIVDGNDRPCCSCSPAKRTLKTLRASA